MTELTTRADRFLRAATVAFIVGWALDLIDHLRRGIAAAPPTLTYLSATHAVLIAIAVTMILRHRKHAPEATVVVGTASVLGLGYVHLMPTYWPAVQDSFISGPRIDVTWFSWMTMLLSIAAAMVWAHAGSRALELRDKNSHNQKPPATRRVRGPSGDESLDRGETVLALHLAEILLVPQQLQGLTQ